MPGDNQGLTEEMTDRDPESGTGQTCGEGCCRQRAQQVQRPGGGKNAHLDQNPVGGQGRGQSGGRSCGPWRPRHRFFFDSGERSGH